MIVKHGIHYSVSVIEKSVDGPVNNSISGYLKVERGIRQMRHPYLLSAVPTLLEKDGQEDENDTAALFTQTKEEVYDNRDHDTMQIDFKGLKGE